MAITLFLEIWSHYIEQLSLTSYVDQVGLHLWQSLAFTFQVPGLQPVFLYTVMAFTKTFSFNCITILTIFTSSNILLSPQTHQCSPPQSCFYFHVVCVCLRFVSFLPAALFLVSTVMASFEAAQSFCFCFLELRHTWSYHILTAALIGEM